MGTGFFISSDGHVVTNANVIDGAQAVYIEYNKKSYPAQFIGADGVTNVCILKTELDPNYCSFLSIAQLQDDLPVASFLIGITCEMGLDPGPVLGLLTGYNLYYGDQTLPTTHIRSDIPSDGGEGGGPVFDINGRFVGMMVASLTDIRSSFILPAKAMIRVRDDILFSGGVSYGYLGLRIDEETAVHAGQPLLIAEVLPNSPAAKAGIAPNDVLLYIDGHKMNHLSDLHNASFFCRPGNFLNIEVSRKGKIVSFSVKIEETPRQENEIFLPAEGIPSLPAPTLTDHNPPSNTTL